MEKRKSNHIFIGGVSLTISEAGCGCGCSCGEGCVNIKVCCGDSNYPPPTETPTMEPPYETATPL